MKTGTVTIRLPIDKIERLKGLAEKRGCSLSELLREPISTWLDLEAIGGGASEEVIAELRKLMLLEFSTWMGSKLWNEMRSYMDTINWTGYNP